VSLNTSKWGPSPCGSIDMGNPDGDKYLFCATSSNQYRKSSVVNGCPSDHLCPLRKWSVKTLLSSISIDVRISGASLSEGVYPTSLAYPYTTIIRVSLGPPMSIRNSPPG